MRLFKDNSNPLEEVALYDVVNGEIYITEEGARVKSEDGEFKVIQRTVLSLGESVLHLDAGKKPNSLALYWSIMNNSR